MGNVCASKVVSPPHGDVKSVYTRSEVILSVVEEFPPQGFF